MRKIYFAIFVFFTFSAAQSQIINFPDPNLKAKLLSNVAAINGQPAVIDANNDGEISVSEAAPITRLHISESNIQNLSGLEHFINLKILFCGSNPFNTLDLTSFGQLEHLYCFGTNITTLNLQNTPNLRVLLVSGTQIASIDVSTLSNLEELVVGEGPLSGLDLSQNLQLTKLRCSNAGLDNLDVSANVQLQELDCSMNQLSSLDLSGLTALKLLDCRNNSLTSLDLSDAPALEQLFCQYNLITSLNLSSPELPNLWRVSCGVNPITSLLAYGLPSLKELNATGCNLSSQNLSDLPQLTEVYAGTNALTSTSFSNLPNLHSLELQENNLVSLDVSGLPSLQKLYCWSNQLASLDLSTAPNLSYVGCWDNVLTSLNLSGLMMLKSLNCYNNLLTTLDCSGFSELESLNCSHNLLSSLSIDGATSVKYFDCVNNQLTSLDVNHMTALTSLECYQNNLSLLLVKNGRNESVNFYLNPNLEYICADEGQIGQIQSALNQYLMSGSCHVNSYCSFVPGGEFYTIQGTNRYDVDLNGCDLLDGFYPNVKINFSAGSSSGAVIADASGSYRFDVQQGIHTFFPAFENPTYFAVSPTSVSVNFPTQVSPSQNDFCIVPNGVHNDLEVALLPLSSARPGFDNYYALVFRNKGTHPQSGVLQLTYDDAIMDFAPTGPPFPIVTTNTLTWDFTNLQPFETRVIHISIDLNGPMDTPAVNAGQEINLSAVIAALSDETPADNVSDLSQIVTNSFDPNDKTCIEGGIVGPETAGDYVHYVIRFENTGTANAQNIVIKDMIDTNKFDIATLVPLIGSHSFVTRIAQGNKVEFIFENINLPFDDANNDGYVAFKIKTKPTLVVGDTFSNTASIYFDYNFPIVTNTATTTIQLLGNPDFEFSEAFVIYPNPAQNTLNIRSKNGVAVNSVSIYNTLGQLVMVETGTATLEVQSLPVGQYFLKVYTENGFAAAPFIKQ